MSNNPSNLVNIGQPGPEFGGPTKGEIRSDTASKITLADLNDLIVNGHSVPDPFIHSERHFYPFCQCCGGACRTVSYTHFVGFLICARCWDDAGGARMSPSGDSHSAHETTADSFRGDQAEAWIAVSKQLTVHNKDWVLGIGTGSDCALREIRRLQALDTARKAVKLPLILTEGHRPGCICEACERTRAALKASAPAPHVHIWSHEGLRNPLPGQTCDVPGCGLKWKDREPSENGSGEAP